MAQILAIDIGSTQITTLTAQYVDSKLELTGAGIAKAQGIKKGTIVNIDQASKSIKQSLNDAKRQAGINIGRAIISISGAHVKSLDSYGIVNIPTREITEKEVNRAMRTALYNASVPVDYEILHALPYNFKIDDQEFIQDPVGMSGSRLEASVHIIIVQKSTLENLKRTVEAAGIEIENVVLAGYASTISTINEDEKELGVCVIDMGGATCNMVVHQGNSIRYNEYLGVGGSHVTGDLSMALHTPLGSAEQVKIERGSLTKLSDGTIELPIMGNESSTQEVSLEIVSNVIYARVEETLMILSKQLEKSGFKNQLGAGIILTGGMTKLDGLRDIASPIFDNLPVRIAKPEAIDGLFESLKDPSFSTAFGLVRYGAGEYTLYEIDSNKNLKSRFEGNNSNSEYKEDIAHDEPNLMDIAEISKTPVKKQEEKKSAIADLSLEKEHDEDSGIKGFANKIWRSATQLF